MQTRVLEGVAHDFFATRTTDELQTLHHIVRLAVFDAGVEVFFIFTDDHHIHGGVLGLHKGVVGNAGAHIGIESKSRACGDIEAFVASALWRGNGCFKEHLGTAERFPGAGFDASFDPSKIDLFAYFDLFDCYASSRLFDDMQGSIHDFWPDTISTGNCNRCVLCHMTVFPIAKQM